jgi:hypothetical protein
LWNAGRGNPLIALYGVHMLAFMDLKVVIKKHGKKIRKRERRRQWKRQTQRRLQEAKKGGGETPLKATGLTRPRYKAQLNIGGKANTITSSTINQKKLLFSPEEPIDGRSSRGRGWQRRFGKIAKDWW